MTGKRHHLPTIISVSSVPCLTLLKLSFVSCSCTPYFAETQTKPSSIRFIRVWINTTRCAWFGAVEGSGKSARSWSIINSSSQERLKENVFDQLLRSSLFFCMSELRSSKPWRVRFWSSDRKARRPGDAMVVEIVDWRAMTEDLVDGNFLVTWLRRAYSEWVIE